MVKLEGQKKSNVLQFGMEGVDDSDEGRRLMHERARYSSPASDEPRKEGSEPKLKEQCLLAVHWPA